MILPFGFIEGIGGPELMLILFIILLLFGANRLPELARGFGKSVREFKKAASSVEHEFKQAMEESERPKPLPAPPATLPQTLASAPPDAPAATPPPPSATTTETKPEKPADPAPGS